jgi:thiamine biosynthesis lipoprotein
MILENKKIKLLSSLFVLLLCICCNNRKIPYTTVAGFTQGTTYSVKYESKKYELFDKEIEELLHHFDLSLSTYIDSSIVSKWNSNLKNETDTLFFNVIKKSLEISEITNGAFDITVAPLIKHWGFYSDSLPKADTAKIPIILNSIGYKNIFISEDNINKKDSNISVDLNAIAQGYAVDILGNFLNKKGIKNWMVEIGGEIKTKGLNERNSPWIIGIDKPVDDNSYAGSMGLQAKVGISGVALATSGNYRNFYVINGRKYSHTINPKTGYPVSHNLLSASIISEDCMTADAIATSCMVLGLEKSKKLIDSLEKTDAYLIFQDEKGKLDFYYSKGFKKYLIN